MKLKLLEVVMALAAGLALVACKSGRQQQSQPGSETSSRRGVPAPSGVEDETSEPKLSFLVRIGTSELRLSEGQELPVQGAFSNPAVSVSVHPERTFARVGVSFEYPRQFVFEADLSAEHSHSWTLSGNELTIMVFRFAGEMPVDEYSKDLARQLGSNSSIAPITTKLGDREYQGRRVSSRVVGHDFTQDVLVLPELKGRARFIVVQDSGKGITQESTITRALLARTFRLTE